MDYIELNEQGNVIGMWANYYDSKVSPIPVDEIKEDEIIRNIYSRITYAGSKPELKIKGNYRKLTVNFYDDNDVLIDFIKGKWSFKIDGKDASDLIAILTTNESNDVNENQIKVKFIGDDSYTNSILTIGFKAKDIYSEIQMEIINL